MSSLYLIRHGQAGLRHEYDTLSELGHMQARLLGEYLVSQKVHFSAVYSGALSRQRETAREVLDAFERSGVAGPEIIVDPGWNEFDLDGVYQAIAPRLAADDPEFQTEHQKLLRMLADEGSPVHRSWTLCDTLLVRAWEGMGMREHLQLSADVMSIMEKTSDAVAARQRLVESGKKPRQVADER